MYLLKDLWCGNINPGERFARDNSEYKKVAKESAACMDQLIAELTPKGSEILEKFLDKNMILSSISDEDAFVCGVRIGARFILDVIGDYKSQFLQAIEEE